jgi:hypothetical protein
MNYTVLNTVIKNSVATTLNATSLSVLIFLAALLYGTASLTYYVRTIVTVCRFLSVSDLPTVLLSEAFIISRFVYGHVCPFLMCPYKYNVFIFHFSMFMFVP